MANSREIWVKIQANVDGMMAGLAKTQKGLSDFDAGLQKSAEKRQAINQIGTTFGLVGVAALAAGAVAVNAFAEFDAAMSAVEATGADAAGSIDDLRAAALDAGARTAFSATEAANAIEELAKAGVSATDILNGGLDGALDLAAAGGLAVADAAAIAATTLKQFGLSGSDMTSVADALAAGAGKAMGDVSDLGQALSQAGLVAAQTGLSMEETTGALAAFANAGMLGSDAGTSLRSALLKLAAPSTESVNIMKDLGISAYDTQGNFVGLAELAGQLQVAFEGKTQAERDSALATIFGSDAVRAANVLFREGRAGVEGWTEAVSEQGFAADVAATRMDNLKGDIEQLGGALETALIGAGEGADGPLRGLVQNLTGLVNTFAALPAPVQTSAMTFLGLTAAVGGTAFVITRAVTGFAELANTLRGVDAELTRGQLFKRGAAGLGGMALLSLAPAASDANSNLGHLTAAAGAAAAGFAVGGPWGAALGGAVGLLGSVATESLGATVSLEGLAATIDTTTQAFTDSSAAMVASKIIDSDMADIFEDIGLSIGTVTDAALGNKAAMAEVGAAFEANGNDAFDAVLAFGQLTGEVEKETIAAERSAEAAEEVTTGKNAAADATEALTAAVEEETQAWIDNAEAMLGQRESEISWQETALETADAIAGGAKVVRDATGAIDENAEGTRNADSALIDLARSSIGLADSMLEAGTGAAEVNARMAESRQAFINAAIAAGYNAAEAEGLANSYGLIPPVAETTIQAFDEASPVISNVMGVLAVLSATIAQPTARLSDAVTGPLGLIAQQLTNLNGQEATVYVRAVQTGLAVQAATSIFKQQAMGGVLKFFANGGIERHVAEIAPPGTTRIWNEPETKGESYIPHANDHRRPRAISVWAETGKILGIPGYAMGAVTGPAQAAQPAGELVARTDRADLDYLATRIGHIVLGGINGAVANERYRGDFERTYGNGGA